MKAGGSGGGASLATAWVNTDGQASAGVGWRMEGRGEREGSTCGMGRNASTTSRKWQWPGDGEEQRGRH